VLRFTWKSILKRLHILTQSKVSQEQELKRDTLRSSAFLVWWANRKKINPVPSDPYRAFRIDRSLKAKLHSTEVWKKKTNRSDSPLVDYPIGSRGKRPKIISRKQQHRKPSKKSIKKLTKQEKRKILYGSSDPFASDRDAQHKKKQVAHARKVLVQEGEKMAQHYGVPTTPLHFSSRDPNQFARIRGDRRVGVIKASIHLRSGKLTASQKLTMLHEQGHVIHARQSYDKSNQILQSNKRFDTLTGLHGQGGQYQKEKIAYNLAEPFIKKLPKGQQAVARWTKRRNLATYQKKMKLKAGTYQHNYATGKSSMVLEFTDQKHKDFANWEKAIW